MKVIYNKYIPFKGYKAFNLCGLIFAKSKLSDVDLNHEAIHVELMKELLYIGFYILYAIEYIIRRLFDFFDTLNEVYHTISFELEAYNYLKNLAYPKFRPHYAWLKYILK